MGDVIGYVDPERGLIHIRKALPLINAATEPRLELSARHDYALFLNESGKPEAALAVLDRARPLYQQFEDDLTQLRLHWLEGKISYGLGKLAEAESIFARLWEEFRVRDLKQEIVLVSIDLARVLTAQGEPARAAEMVAQCYSIMAGWGLHRDALAAWLVLQEALAHRTARDATFQEIERYYRRHWVRPGAFKA
jgi:ATP/maltotriose-dependent transcriptional regulator MalT